MDDKNTNVDPPVVFGRQLTLEYLEQRVQHCGLTAVTGGPMTGKSAVLSELDRRLRADGRYLVGMYEAKAREVSHFLYAIANLYERWLADASMHKQATVLWRQHSTEWIPRVGQAVGRVLKVIAGKDATGLGELVSSAFDGLKALQEELKSARLSLAPLPYDQTRDLANLVNDITGKRVVLILDEWGGSADPPHERQTLETFLKHTQEWHQTHIVFAVRATIGPERDGEDLTFLRRSELAQVHKLPPLDLSSESERKKLLLYLRERVPASADASDDELVELIGGMPGVVSRWVEGARLGSLETLRQSADEAHAFRYTDLARALDRLPKEALLLCARVSFLPGLNRQIWGDCRAAVLEGLDSAVLDYLVGGVLERHPEDIRIPSFGHETRHAAARRHITREYPYLMTRVADELIEHLASRISGVEDKDAFAVAVLASREKVLSAVDCSAISQFLVAAAASVMGTPVAVAKLAVEHAALKAAAHRVPGITPLVAMGLVNRGVQLTVKRDFAGAAADFAAVIELPDVPDWPLKNALFNRAKCRQELNDRAGARADLTASEKLLDERNVERSMIVDYGLLHFMLGDYREAVSYYTKVVDSPSVSAELRGRAFHGRGAAKYQLNEAAGAIADFTAALDIKETPAKYRAATLSARGTAKYSIGDVPGSLADFSARIEFPLGPVAGTGLALAYLARGFSRKARGESDGAIADFDRAINSSDGSPQERAQAFLQRGALLQERKNFRDAREDFSRAIALGSAAGEFLAQGHLARAILLSELDDRSAARADFLAAANATEDSELQRTAREMAERLNETPHRARSPSAQADEVALELLRRAAGRGRHGDIDGEIADCTTVIELPNAPADKVALALCNRGARRGERGDSNGEIADYTAAIELPNAPADKVALALCHRGARRGQHGDINGEIGDYTAVIDLPNAPADQVALALCNRGVRRRERGDTDGEIADYTEVIELPNAPTDYVARALYNRSVTKSERGDTDGAIADCTALIKLPNAPDYRAARAMYYRGVLKGNSGDVDGAIADFTAVIALPKPPVDVVAKAMCNRADLRTFCGDKDGAVTDYTTAINLPNAPREVVEAARTRLTTIAASSGGAAPDEMSSNR
jgi:tetratricopeptide (TPR) repeat protein